MLIEKWINRNEHNILNRLGWSSIEMSKITGYPELMSSIKTLLCKILSSFLKI